MKKILLFITGFLIFLSLNAQTWTTTFFDDFNRADGSLGPNYSVSSAAMPTPTILSNEVKISSTTSPAYWKVSYVNGITNNNIRVSCYFRAPTIGYGFGLNARDNGSYTYTAAIMSESDDVLITKRDYVGGSTTLASQKANLDISKTYYLEFTLKNSDLTFKFVESTKTDTIKLIASDNTVTGINVNFSGYQYQSNLTSYVDNFKIESFNNPTGFSDIKEYYSSIFPNPADAIITFFSNKEATEDSEIRIYNTLGNLVKSEIVNQNSKIIDISNLNCGIYFLTIKSKGGTEIHKLIVKR